MILCECGRFIEGNTFKDYIKTSANPSTPTIGHEKCGIVFDFIDNKRQKTFSSKKELKSLAMRFAEKYTLEYDVIEKFLLEIDRLKSTGNLSDNDIINTAFKKYNSG